MGYRPPQPQCGLARAFGGGGFSCPLTYLYSFSQMMYLTNSSCWSTLSDNNYANRISLSATNDGLVRAISWSYTLTAGTACQRIYYIFLEGLFCIFARLVRLQTNSLGSITSRILLIPPATAYYIRYGPGGLSCMLIYLPRYQRISIGSRRATSCVFDYYHYHWWS